MTTSNNKKRNIEELLFTPPGSPKRNRFMVNNENTNDDYDIESEIDNDDDNNNDDKFISDMSPSIERENQSKPKFRTFLDCFFTCLNHTGYCTENEYFTWHKGIDPEYPKGHYCCQNVCYSSDQTLQIKSIGVVFLVYGKLGPLGTLDEKSSSDIRKRIEQLGGNRNVDIEVTGFSCFKDDVKLKRISDGCYPPKYQPNSVTWKIVISLYSITVTPLRILPWTKDDNTISKFEREWDSEISIINSNTHNYSSGYCTPPPTTKYLTIHSNKHLTV